MYASAEELIAEEYAGKVLTLFDVGIDRADKADMILNLSKNCSRFDQLEVDSQPKMVLRNFCVRFVEHIESESDPENKAVFLENFYKDNESKEEPFAVFFKKYLNFNRRFAKKFDNFNFVNSVPICGLIFMNLTDASSTDVLTRNMSTFSNYLKRVFNNSEALIEFIPVLFVFIDNEENNKKNLNEFEKNLVATHVTNKNLSQFPTCFVSFLLNKTFPALIGRHTVLLQNLIRIKKALVSSNLLSTAREFFKYGVNSSKSQRYFPMFHPSQNDSVKAFTFLSAYIKNRVYSINRNAASFDDRSKSKRENQKNIYFSKFKTIKEIADLLFILKVHTNCHTIYNKLKKQSHEFLPTELSYAAMEMSLYCKIFTGKFDRKPLPILYAECEFVLKWYNANSIFTAVRLASVMAEKLCQQQKHTEAFLLLNSLNTRQQADWPIVLQRAAYCYEKSMPRKFYYQIIFAGVQYFVMGRLGFSYGCFQPVKRSSLELFRKNWHNMSLFALINLSSLFASFGRNEDSVREIIQPLVEYVSVGVNILGYTNYREQFYQDVLKIVFKTCMVNEMNATDQVLGMYSNWLEDVFGLVFFLDGGFERVSGNFDSYYVLEGEKVGVRVNRFYFSLEFEVSEVAFEDEQGVLLVLQKRLIEEDEAFFYFEFEVKENVKLKRGIFSIGLKLNNNVNSAKIKIDFKSVITFERLAEDDVRVGFNEKGIEYEVEQKKENVKDVVLICKNFSMAANYVRTFTTMKDTFYIYIYQVGVSNKIKLAPNKRTFYNNYKETAFVNIVRYKNGFCRVMDKVIRNVEKYRNYICDNENLIKNGAATFSVNYSYEKVTNLKEYLEIYTGNNLSSVDNIFSLKLIIKTDVAKTVKYVSSEYFSLVKEETKGENLSYACVLAQKKMLDSSAEHQVVFEVDESRIFVCDMIETDKPSVLLSFEYPVVVNHKFRAGSRCKTVDLVVKVREIESELVERKNDYYLILSNDEKSSNYGAYVITGPCKVALFDTARLKAIRYSMTIFKHRDEPFDLNGNFYIRSGYRKVPITNILPLYVRNAE